MHAKTTLGMIVLAAGLAGAAPAMADTCAAGKTLKDGVLTVATGNPAYFPWVIDNKPASGKGYEAAVAYEVAKRMGFGKDKVVWTSASFDQSIQPGAKDFDFNLQQFSITAEREKVVDFSAPYYAAAMAVLVRKPTVAAGAKPTLASIKGLKWGVVGTTTAMPMLRDLIKPTADPLLYNDTADVVQALKSNQIDAGLFDLPTALYLSAVELEDGAVLGQFPADRAANPDRFGLLMADGNPLKACVDAAIEAMRADGTLAKIEAKWLAENTGVPVIE